MRLFETRKDRWPRQAGKAVLEYEHTGEPVREGNKIIIPDDGRVELFRLQKGWNQFLVGLGENSLWFGGTDENPFLVRLGSDVFDEFVQSPKGFYSLLVPKLIRNLQEKFPSVTYVRQGDIFAFPLPYSWEELEKAFNICHWYTLAYKEVKKAELMLFGTRHTLSGVNLVVGEESGFFRGLVTQLVEGTVNAPDHTTRVLEGPHVIAQTAHLYSPKEAD